MKQLDEIDDNVRRQLADQDKAGDKLLQEKLAARRRKKNANLEKQREMKSDQLQ